MAKKLLNFIQGPPSHGPQLLTLSNLVWQFYPPSSTNQAQIQIQPIDILEYFFQNGNCLLQTSKRVWELDNQMHLRAWKMVMLD
jgi:hypothetical protein